MRITSCPICSERSHFNQSKNIPVSRVLGALGEFGPLGRGEIAFEPIEQAIEYFDLAIVQLRSIEMIPEAGLLHHRRQSIASLLY